jgi:hypothetical protein
MKLLQQCHEIHKLIEDIAFVLGKKFGIESHRRDHSRDSED